MVRSKSRAAKNIADLLFLRMIYRLATTADIPEIMRVRFAVKENTLSRPGLVTDADCDEYINHRGKVGYAMLETKSELRHCRFAGPQHLGTVCRTRI